MPTLLPNTLATDALLTSSDEDLLHWLSQEQDTNVLKMIGQELYTRLILRGGYTFEMTEEEEQRMAAELDAAYAMDLDAETRPNDADDTPPF